MGWKFWQKNSGADPIQKLPKPKDLPSGIGRYLIVDLKHDPDWVWTLKSVSMPKDGSKIEKRIRIYDDTSALAKGVSVKNFISLDGQPELILFEGWYDKDSWDMEIIEHKHNIIQTPAA